MRLKRVYVRFYKSFNYDYERKFNGGEPDPWDSLEGAWYPFVRLDLEDSTTTIVGANESGKSHLLDAIERLITGRSIERSDFCRYSRFFSVQEGHRRSPDFGGEFEAVTEAELKSVQSLGLKVRKGERFRIFRMSGQAPVGYVQGQPAPLDIDDAALKAVLPLPFRLHADLALPASIPLYELTPDAKRPYGSRRSRRSLVEGLLAKSWSSADEFTKAAPSLFPLVSGWGVAPEDVEALDQQYELGRELLFRVAKIDQTTFKDLADALEEEREGYVNGVIQRINGALATHLNFPRWWAQDRDFRLLVSPREHELVFTIRDRTGTDYSFAERSNGLKYFLSYHVQLLAHRPPADGRSEILLMDEPDAFLSSQGQQDLLRILDEFSQPEDKSRDVQVVYVTHSQFLINRNAAQRIRVLDKGVTDEGTRVVKDVARNHYEPLRSSLGAFVAETSFIGGSNLFVEGLADQVLLAGVNSLFLGLGFPRTELLDLNTVTIVPCGSASSVPYLVYLARGRDVIRPPSVALLDSDQEGNEAAKVLSRGGPRRAELLADKFVMQIGSWAKSVSGMSLPPGLTAAELEDLIPVRVAVEAARSYAIRMLSIEPAASEAFTEAAILQEIAGGPGGLFDAVTRSFARIFGGDAHIEKVGFAKEVVTCIQADRVSNPDAVIPLRVNFGPLLGALAKQLRLAAREEQERRQANRLTRTISGFLADFPNPTTRERAKLLVEEIVSSAEDNPAGDLVRLEASKLVRDFSLDEDLLEPVEDYERFRERVSAIRYSERFVNQEGVATDSVGAPPAETGAEPVAVPTGTAG